MELIDRYLQAVRFALPRSQRDDIVQELKDSLLSQIEEREAALGRALTEDEQVDLLRKMGSPMQLASRYRDQQGLIGPTVLPIYWKVLKWSLGIAFLVQVLASIATAAAGRPLLVSMEPIFHYPAVALTVFAWVTLTFAALYFFGCKIQLNEHWNPRTLPPVVKAERKKSLVDSVASLVIGALAAVWWLAGLHNPWLILGPGAAFMTFAPVWLSLYPLFVALGIAEVLRHSLEIVRPYATRAHTITRMVTRILSLTLLAFLIRAGDTFVLTGSQNPQMQPLMTNINFSLHLGLIVAAVVQAAQLVVNTWKMIAGRVEQTHEAALGS